MENIFRRKVYYIGGFDPRGPSHYHALYKEEAAAQCKINGMQITVGDRQRVSPLISAWQVHSKDQDQVVETEYLFLRWDDIVRKHWPVGPRKLLPEFLYAARIYVFSGLFRKLWKIAWPPTLAGVFPAFFTLLAIGAIGSTIGIARAFQLPASTTVTLMFCILLGLVWFWRRAERRFNLTWIMRIIAFIARYARGEVPELDTRIDAFVEIMDQTNLDETDEMLVVGHSVGAMVAVSTLARLLEKKPGYAGRRTQLSFLTLGHCLPVITVHPTAVTFFRELLTVADKRRVKWIDFTAPSDGACYALCDPIKVAGLVRTTPNHHSPKVLSPRYVHLFSKPTYARLRRDKFRMHFQYLMASEKTGDYDYFAITAANEKLLERFAHLAPVLHYRKP